uniref:Uncharacterized protein n=1 Tax=Meloidogyne enterolobii TaxID=390850 RepID=A0A6V7YAT0_MELEN|nr:unnamed protein product [Meloidogyne enterolobii]
MWRTASMHIIGKLLNRTVYYESIYKCFTEYRQEFEITFKNGGQIIKLMNPKQKYIKKISFGIGCCDFDSPYRLEGENAQIIQVTGSEFKSFKYFEDSREEIHKMFEFNEDIKLAADEAAEGIFRNYTPEYRLCLHTHRHEYIEAGQASTLEFIEGSIKFVMNRLQNMPLYFLGMIKIFFMKLSRKKGIIFIFLNKQYFSPCSSFAWWMGYLMPENKNGNIFYNNCNGYCKCNKQVQNYFMPNWVPLHKNKTDEIDIDENIY